MSGRTKEPSGWGDGAGRVLTDLCSLENTEAQKRAERRCSHGAVALRTQGACGGNSHGGTPKRTLPFLDLPPRRDSSSGLAMAKRG